VKFTRTAIRDCKLLAAAIALMWMLQIINLGSDYSLRDLAIVPRQIDSLFGIFTMHFLHWSIPHLLSNTLPLAILGCLVCIDGKAVRVTLTIMLSTGLLVWLFARAGGHAGASALVLGYWSYLISCAIFDRSFKNILLAIMTILIYGGLLISLIDIRASTSFEGHAFGFIAGIMTAWFWRKEIKTRNRRGNR